MIKSEYMILNNVCVCYILYFRINLWILFLKPKGATHQCNMGEYWDFEALPKPMVWRGEWVMDDTCWYRKFEKLEVNESIIKIIYISYFAF